MMKTSFKFLVVPLVAGALISCQKTPDFSGLEERVAALEKTALAIRELPSKVASLTAELQMLADSLETLRAASSAEKAGKIDKAVKALDSKVAALSNMAPVLETMNEMFVIQGELMEKVDSIAAAEASTINATLDSLQAQAGDIKQAAIDELLSKVEALDVEALQETVNTLKTALEKLGVEFREFADSVRNMVQSVTFMPKYSGGAAVVDVIDTTAGSNIVRRTVICDTLAMDFLMLPASAGKAVADKWNGGDKAVLKFRYATNHNRAALPADIVKVSSVAFCGQDSLVKIGVKWSDAALKILASKDKSLSFTLEVSDGITSVSSSNVEVDRRTAKKVEALKAVDLGLSVLWANVNLGATRPEDPGDFFAWGATEPFYEPGYATSDANHIVWRDGIEGGYCWKNCPYNGGFDSYDSESWFTYAPGILEYGKLLPGYDAASVILGGGWRMPTSAEVEELIVNNWNIVYWNPMGPETDDREFAGFKIERNDGVTSIFLPAAGFREGTEFRDAGTGGYYWSSNAIESGASGMVFYPQNWGPPSQPETQDRCKGFCIRPVLDK